jgi:ABC-2 type transport system permease protein
MTPAGRLLMSDASRTWTRIRRQAHASYVIAKKDAAIYYLKPPVISFGIVFPLFFYLAFAAGRNVPPNSMVPGIVAMALFFTASAVGPLVTPWERQARTYERLVTSPASLWAILIGDTAAGAVFGLVLCLVPLLIGCVLLGSTVASAISLSAGIVLGAVAFSALGVLMAARPAETPSEIMMLSNLVRLPLIFISGVFLPFAEMPAWGQRLAPISPLSYAADLIRVGLGGPAYFSVVLDVVALLAFSGVLLLLAHRLHRRAQSKV